VGRIFTFGRICVQQWLSRIIEDELFEALYGRKCRVLISWYNPVDKVTLGPKLLREMEQAIVQIRKNINISQDRQKSYVD
jgi:hypothetical protein